MGCLAWLIASASAALPWLPLKASRRVSPGDLKGLRALAEETTLKKRMVVSMESGERRTDEGITILPVLQFFEDLWAGRIIEDPRGG